MKLSSDLAECIKEKAYFPKPVSSSHLALRFYKRHGWTREELAGCLLTGIIEDSAVRFLDPEEGAYLVAAPGSVWDWDKLMPHISEIERYPGAPDYYHEMTTEQYAMHIGI